jgi:hypothetical protein
MVGEILTDNGGGFVKIGGLGKLGKGVQWLWCA